MLYSLQFNSFGSLESLLLCTFHEYYLKHKPHYTGIELNGTVPLQ